MLWIIIGVVIAICLMIAGWMTGFYNTVIDASEDIKGQWADILTEYQRRADLFMNLINTVKSSKNFEKETLVELTKARSGISDIKNDKPKQMQTMKTLDHVFHGLKLHVEAYPDLKSVGLHSQLMNDIKETENRINAGRGEYNNIVEDYNTYIKTFPNLILRKLFSFSCEEYFETSKDLSAAPEIKL